MLRKALFRVVAVAAVVLCLISLILIITMVPVSDVLVYAMFGWIMVLVAGVTSLVATHVLVFSSRFRGIKNSVFSLGMVLPFVAFSSFFLAKAYTSVEAGESAAQYAALVSLSITCLVQLIWCALDLMKSIRDGAWAAPART